MKINILVLAAGASSRMGRSKQLLSVAGESLLLFTTKTALATSAHNVLLVLGSGYDKHKAVVTGLPVETVFHSGWHRGMGSSLKFGLTNLLGNHPDTDAVLILVCDQPLLTAQHLERITNAYQAGRQPVIASQYAGTAGVPVLFDKRLFAELLAIRDDEGAKKIITRHRQQAYYVDFPGGETDLDTPADYDEYLKKH